MKPNWRLDVLCILLLCCGAVAVYFGMSWLPGCPFHEYTGLYCPGCGMTRSIRALLHLDIRGFLRNNILALPVFALFVALRLKPALQRSRAVGISVIVVLGVFWIIRNIPVWPFTLLAPV